MKKTQTTEMRINVLVRLVGLIFLGVGIALGYYTATTPVAPALLSIFYFISALFAVSGLIAIVVKLE